MKYEPHRPRHRPDRDLRRRAVRLQGGLRGLRADQGHGVEQAPRALCRDAAGAAARPAGRRTPTRPRSPAPTPTSTRTTSLYYAGDSNAGSKTIAINLPNDEQVQLEKGTRRLQLKNAMRAKFDKIMLPIADELIVPEQRKHVTFDAFFADTMFHEVAHGLGIKNTLDGKGTVRDALKELGGGLEEGKADILGLYMITKLHEKGELGGSLEDYYVTFLTGIFRSVRFGAASAHGQANMLRFNFFADRGAFSARCQRPLPRRHGEDAHGDGRAVGRLILKLQGDGDYAGVKKLLARARRASRPQLAADLARLGARNIPVDVTLRAGQGRAGPEVDAAVSSPVERVIEPRPRDLGDFTVRRAAARGGPADRRPVHLLRSHGTGRVRAGAGRQRAAAPAHRPRDRDVPVRRRVHAPRQPRHGAGDPAGRRQLDGGRSRHRAFGAHAAGGARRRTAAPVRTASRPGSRCRVADEEREPSFAHHGAASLPRIERPGVSLTVIAGTAYGERSPVEVFSPTLYVDAQLDAGATLEVSSRARAARPATSRRVGSKSTASATTKASSWCSRQTPVRCRPCARAVARDARRRRGARRAAAHLLELRVEFARAHRGGQARLARTAICAGAGRSRSGFRCPTSERPALSPAAAAPE